MEAKMSKNKFTCLFLILSVALSGCGPGVNQPKGTETPNPKYTNTVLMQAAEDTNTKELYPNQVKGDSDKVDVWNYPDQDKIAYMKFDLSHISQGTIVRKATLRLWIYDVKDPGLVEFYTVQGTWHEDSLTYNTQDGLSLLPRFSRYFENHPDQTYVDIDVTSLVQEWVNGSIPNDGISMKAPDTSVPVRVEFHSKEALTNPSYLQIDLE
jgi:hypothetical protein